MVRSCSLERENQMSRTFGVLFLLGLFVCAVPNGAQANTNKWKLLNHAHSQSHLMAVFNVAHGYTLMKGTQKKFLYVVKGATIPTASVAHFATYGKAVKGVGGKGGLLLCIKIQVPTLNQAFCNKAKAKAISRIKGKLARIKLRAAKLSEKNKAKLLKAVKTAEDRLKRPFKCSAYLARVKKYFAANPYRGLLKTKICPKFASSGIYRVINKRLTKYTGTTSLSALTAWMKK